MEEKKTAPITHPENKAEIDSKEAPDAPDNLKESPDNLNEASDNLQDELFPVVGIGASAGGLEAFSQLLMHIPSDTGMAFVLIQHLDPIHKSVLPEILSRVTSMSVIEASDGRAVEANHVYVIPPNTNMAISHGILHLLPRIEEQKRYLPIDYFFRSLAQDRQSRAIGVILSGTASDGSLGMQAIKAEGGITFAQDEKSAKYSGMPHSAAMSGTVDFILPPEEMAGELVRIGKHPSLAYAKLAKIEKLPLKEENNLNKIFILLRDATGADFTYYKHASIARRIERRMILHKISKMPDYVRYLMENTVEVDALYQDILISVTSFFRDPEMFEVLKEDVFPQMMKDRPPDLPIRIWVPGCATGEEAYSMAMSLLEFFEGMTDSPRIQIFGTDINEKAIVKARFGSYPENIKADVSPERLQRFFTRVEDNYKISRQIRDLCIFARQDVTKDPPFLNLDLISCQNVLIYLGSVLQKRVIPIFHYGLKTSGFLVLGTSESIGTFADLFKLVDKKYKIYLRKLTSTRLPIDLVKADDDYMTEKKGIGTRMRNTSEQSPYTFNLTKEVDALLLARYAPAGVVINNDMEIIQFRGHTDTYLSHVPGKASLNLLKMSREGLVVDLRRAIQEAQKTGMPVRKENVRVKYHQQYRAIHLEVIPVKTPSDELLILFESAAPAMGLESKEVKPNEVKGGMEKEVAGCVTDPQVAQLSRELETTKEYLQSIIEDKEASNEELRVANEEIQSSNEELQSINEELETAKEELQSTNEELVTVNEELQNRNVELGGVNDDLSNLINSVNIPIIILGNDLRIRRFTPAVQNLMHVLPSDIGRSIADIKLDINIPDFEQLIAGVMDTIQIKEQEIQTLDGKWYLMRIRPYKATGNRIEGSVITAIDISELKQSQEQLRMSRDFAEAIVGTVREPLVVLDARLRIISVNEAYSKIFQVNKKDMENALIYEVGNRQWDIPELRKLLDTILPANSHFQDFEIEQIFPIIGYRKMLLNARRIYQKDGATQMILLAIEDVTGKGE